MMKTCLRPSLALIILCFTSSAAAITFSYTGFVTGGTGAGPLLAPAGDSVFLTFDAAVMQAGDIVNSSDITSLEFYVGGICFSAIMGTGQCVFGGVEIPVIDIQTDMMEFTPFADDPFDGKLNFVAFSPTVIVSPLVNINFSTLTFSINLSSFGSISGCLNEGTPESEPCYAPVPLPGAILFLGSALLMLVRLQRQTEL